MPAMDGLSLCRKYATWTRGFDHPASARDAKSTV